MNITISNEAVRELTGVAAEINNEHSLAMNHADIAVDHAKRAGELLLQVKASLPHGEFLPWVAANITVSERQAQRYIRAALGKPTPIRAIANTTPVSDLSWLPRKGYLASMEFSDGAILKLQESADHKGFYFAFYATGSVDTGGPMDFTIKPIHSSFVEYALSGWLPGSITRSCKVSDLPWQYDETHDPYFLKALLSDSLPKGYEHLRHSKAA